MYYNGLTRLFSVLICVLITSLSVSCRKDLDFENSTTTLRFSQDTVFLDTLFTRSNSETYLLKVYNPSDDDISLSQVYLNQRDNSSFRINIDGQAGFEFSEIPLRANDSLLVFVEAAIDQANPTFMAEDELMFSDSNQEIKLLAMVEEAKYYYGDNQDDSFYIPDNSTLDNSISHVIYGTLKVRENETLNITEGAQVYFHHNSGIEVESGGTLNIQGSLTHPIRFRSDRHDTRYDTLPKLWNHIKLTNANLSINHAILKGGTNGLVLENSSAEIQNTQIYNMSYSGIFAKNSTIEAKNVAISAAAGACLNIEKGGNYNFLYSTFANIWESTPVGISGSKVPAYLSNYTIIQDEDGTETEEFAPFTGTFANCIFYGDYQNGVYFDPSDQSGFNYTFDSCLFKNEDTDQYDYTTDTNIINAQLGNPIFTSTLLSDQDLRIQTGAESNALFNANPMYNSTVPHDIKGVLRSSVNPTIGAYEN